MLSMICSSSAVPSVVTTRACVSPRVKSAEPCVLGRTSISHVIGRMSVADRPSVLTPLLAMEARMISCSMTSNRAFTGFTSVSARRSAKCESVSDLTALMAATRASFPLTKFAVSSFANA